MTPREIIIRNMEFRNPERIGMVFHGGRMNDFCRSGPAPSLSHKQKRWMKDGFEYYEDEWGNIWHRIPGKSSKGEIFSPALEDWSGLSKLKIPDFSNPAHYAEAAEKFRACPGLYRVGNLPGFPFAICRYLRRMDVYLQDLALERKNIDALHEIVTGLLEKAITRWSEAGADAVMFAEDWGTQQGLLISPPMWRDIFAPLYSRLCRKAKEEGMHVIMHSCGQNSLILSDLAEAGINCFQFDQPALYGLEELSRALKKLRVCLYSPVDIQRVLVSRDLRVIEENARLMIELFGKPGGGFIATTYGDPKGIGVSPEAEERAYRAFRENMFL